MLKRLLKANIMTLTVKLSSFNEVNPIEYLEYSVTLVVLLIPIQC